MIFGGGTQLTVVPKKKPEKTPEISILYPPVNSSVKGDEVPPAVCLASKFYPKEVEVKMSRSSQSTLTDTSVVTEDGYYSSSNFLPPLSNGQKSSITCEVKHNNKLIEPKVEVVNQTAPETVKPCELWTSNQKIQTDLPKENSMSLTVIGLRILFLKSIAFNVMMTARAWII
ncbi:T cell receptor delta constant isoform X1 [Hypanus sabinus]|uniref:T cell receptor delta constant isoform X1 n=1 Tax=Hypanus sabinus TaxID=79690 RepID=UPI0028C37A2E|nr:T cell receptor delta constant isoform X1 [Hypanus sabinus]